MLQPKLIHGGNYIAEARDSNKTTWLLFSPETPDEAGSLAKFLSIFSTHGVNLSHIESRSSARRPGYEFMVECEHGSGDFGAVLADLKKNTGYLNIISRDYKDNRCKLISKIPDNYNVSNKKEQLIQNAYKIECENRFIFHVLEY